MSKDPAFLFYTSDFLTGTMFMSNEQIGIYIRLLCAQHQHGAMIEEKAFNSLVKDDELLRSKFIKCEGGYYNERLMKEMVLRNKKSSNISSAMKEVWEKRKMESQEKSIESYNNSKSKLKKKERKLIGTEIENEDENEDINTNKESSLISSETLISSLRSDEKIKMQVIRSYAWMEDEYNTALNDFIFRCETEGSISGRTYSDFATHFLNFARRNRDTFKPKPKGKSNSANEMLSQAARLAEKIKQRQ